MLKKYISSIGLNASYVTKNSAPRETYLKLLSKLDLKKEVNIKQLFRSPFGLCKTLSNYYDKKVKASTSIDELIMYIKNSYTTMMARGIKECYVYAYNENLRNYLKNYIKKGD